MTFRWITAPDPTFIDGFQRYQDTLFNALALLMQSEAVRCEQFMRANATWEDDCMPDKEYLRAFPFVDADLMEVGIVAYYDQDLYDKTCGTRGGFPFGFTHEVLTFTKKGVISVIVPRSFHAVLGDFAEELWARVVAIMAGGAAPSGSFVTDVVF